MNLMENAFRRAPPIVLAFVFAIAFGPLAISSAFAMEPAAAAAPQQAAGGEANLVIPDLNSVQIMGMPGGTLLLAGLVVCALGLLFGLVMCSRLKNLPVHQSMREVSELIYETCKTYLITQGKFILLLWLFIAGVVVAYYGFLHPVPTHPVAVT